MADIGKVVGCRFQKHNATDPQA